MLLKVKEYSWNHFCNGLPGQDGSGARNQSDGNDYATKPVNPGVVTTKSPQCYSLIRLIWLGRF